MNFHRLGAPVLQFRLLDYDPNRESTELPSEEDQTTHCVTLTPSRSAMMGSIDLVTDWERDEMLSGGI